MSPASVIENKVAFKQQIPDNVGDILKLEEITVYLSRKSKSACAAMTMSLACIIEKNSSSPCKPSQ